MTDRPQIQTLSLAQWAKGTAWRAELPHSSAAHALVFVTRGQGLSTILGKRRGVGINNVIVIPAGTLFSFDLGRTGSGQVCLIKPDAPVLLPDEPLHLRLRQVSEQAELAALFDVLHREQSANRPFMGEALMAHANLLSLWLRRRLITEEDPPSRITASERLVRAYATLVERDFMTGQMMADYARILGVTPTHLTRCCKQISGITASEMITGRILYAALDMIEQTRDPIRQIAKLLGFRSAAYFSRFILHHTGQTPLKLRKHRNIKLLAKAS